MISSKPFSALFLPVGMRFATVDGGIRLPAVAGMHVLGEGWDWRLILNDVVCREQTVHDDMNS